MLFIQLASGLDCISTPKCILKANNMLLVITASLIGLPDFNFLISSYHNLFGSWLHAVQAVISLLAGLLKETKLRWQRRYKLRK